jgi:hypothetical protein
VHLNEQERGAKEREREKEREEGDCYGFVPKQPKVEGNGGGG